MDPVGDLIRATLRKATEIALQFGRRFENADSPEQELTFAEQAIVRLDRQLTHAIDDKANAIEKLADQKKLTFEVGKKYAAHKLVLEEIENMSIFRIMYNRLYNKLKKRAS